MHRLSSWVSRRVPWRVRFKLAYGLLALIAVGAIFAFGMLVHSGGSSNGRTSGSGPGDGGSSPSSPAELTGFPLELQAWADAARQAYGGPKIQVVDCIQGGPGDFMCAYKMRGMCMLSHVLIDHDQIEPQGNGETGRVAVPLAQCTTANGLHWIGKQGG